MTDIRQSPLYAHFLQSIGWGVENIDGVNIFIKPFPLIGAVIKIQRCEQLPDLSKLKNLVQKYHTHSISIELNVIARSSKNDEAIFHPRLINHNYQFLKSPYLPTKTIHIDLTPVPKQIFNSFSEAKRRAVRRAEKNNIKIIQTNNIDEFIQLKNSTAGFLGFLTTKTVKPLWKIFASKNAFCLLAYLSSHPELVSGSQKLRNETRSRNKFGMTISGVLVLIWEKTAYYWMASATDQGKKSFAPTLLVWEALKEAKKRGATIFDFEGIYDERYPQENKNWLGFSKFKSGFGGQEIYYPKPIKIILNS